MTRCVSGFYSCAYSSLPFVNSLRSNRTTEGTASTHKISEASLSHWTGELLTPADCRNMKNIPTLAWVGTDSDCSAIFFSVARWGARGESGLRNCERPPLAYFFKCQFQTGLRAIPYFTINPSSSHKSCQSFAPSHRNTWPLTSRFSFSSVPILAISSSVSGSSVTHFRLLA